MSKQKQSGFAHLAIITVILALAVVGLLGFVFWQNVNNNGANKAATPSKDDSKDDSKPSVSQTAELTEIASDQTHGTGAAVKYPKSWSYSHANDEFGADESTIKSPDGDVSVVLRVFEGSFMESLACKNGLGSILTVNQLGTDDITGLGNARYSAFVLQQRSDSGEQVYSYYAGLQNNSDTVRSAKVGSDSCGFSGSSIYELSSTEDGQSMPAVTALTLEIKFDGVDNLKGSTLGSFNEFVKKDSYKTAKQIVQSVYVKK